jgi:outer membrane receptor protein involved in Fe transport
VITGGAEDYRAATGERGEKVAEGAGQRRAAAAFAQLDLRPVSRVRLTLGGRVDAIQDTFDPVLPGGTEATTTNTALSPKAGVNIRYA